MPREPKWTPTFVSKPSVEYWGLTIDWTPETDCRKRVGSSVFVSENGAVRGADAAVSASTEDVVAQSVISDTMSWQRMMWENWNVVDSQEGMI